MFFLDDYVKSTFHRRRQKVNENCYGRYLHFEEDDEANFLPGFIDQAAACPAERAATARLNFMVKTSNEYPKQPKRSASGTTRFEEMVLMDVDAEKKLASRSFALSVTSQCVKPKDFGFRSYEYLNMIRKLLIRKYSEGHNKTR